MTDIIVDGYVAKEMIVSSWDDYSGDDERKTTYYTLTFKFANGKEKEVRFHD